MNRYFGKIEEWDKFIYWEWDKNTNDTLINLLPTINHSKHCMSVSGNLFIVLDSIKAKQIQRRRNKRKLQAKQWRKDSITNIL